MGNKHQQPHSMFTGIPMTIEKWQQNMNMERAGAELTLGEVVKFLKKKKKLPKYTPPEKGAWWK